jgi:hypothetical protein
MCCQSKQDVEIPEGILWNELGTQDDYKKESGDNPNCIKITLMM